MSQEGISYIVHWDDSKDFNESWKKQKLEFLLLRKTLLCGGSGRVFFTSNLTTKCVEREKREDFFKLLRKTKCRLLISIMMAHKLALMMNDNEKLFFCFTVKLLSINYYFTRSLLIRTSRWVKYSGIIFDTIECNKTKNYTYQYD